MLADQVDDDGIVTILDRDASSHVPASTPSSSSGPPATGRTTGRSYTPTAAMRRGPRPYSPSSAPALSGRWEPACSVRTRRRRWNRTGRSATYGSRSRLAARGPSSCSRSSARSPQAHPDLTRVGGRTSHRRSDRPEVAQCLVVRAHLRAGLRADVFGSRHVSLRPARPLPCHRNGRPLHRPPGRPVQQRDHLLASTGRVRRG